MEKAAAPITHESPAIIVIGVGNEYRRDDAAGLLVVRRLKEVAYEFAADQGFTARLEIIEESGEGTALMDAWKGADVAIVVDAVYGEQEPGGIYRGEFSAAESSPPLPVNFYRHSTHAFGLGEAIELARSFGTLPLKVIVYGIEVVDVTAGLGLSPEVEESIDHVVGAILIDLQSVTSIDRLPFREGN
jgi:hydrogenase maturation protease